MRSPTEHTMKYLRGLGGEVRVVEKWNQWAKKRQDLWGADVQAILGMKLIGIQSTSGDHHADRLAKALANPEVRQWLMTGNAFEIWSWRKAGKQGKRRVWTPRVTQLALTDHGEVKALGQTLIEVFSNETT